MKPNSIARNSRRTLLPVLLVATLAVSATPRAQAQEREGTLDSEAGMSNIGPQEAIMDLRGFLDLPGAKAGFEKNDQEALDIFSALDTESRLHQKVAENLELTSPSVNNLLKTALKSKDPQDVAKAHRGLVKAYSKNWNAMKKTVDAHANKLNRDVERGGLTDDHALDYFNAELYPFRFISASANKFIQVRSEQVLTRMRKEARRFMADGGVMATAVTPTPAVSEEEAYKQRVQRYHFWRPTLEKMAENDVGALAVLNEILGRTPDDGEFRAILERLNADGISGQDIYIGYYHACRGDINLFLTMLKNGTLKKYIEAGKQAL